MPILVMFLPELEAPWNTHILRLGRLVLYLSFFVNEKLSCSVLTGRLKRKVGGIQARLFVRSHRRREDCEGVAERRPRGGTKAWVRRWREETRVGIVSADLSLGSRGFRGTVGGTKPESHEGQDLPDDLLLVNEGDNRHRSPQHGRSRGSAS